MSQPNSPPVNGSFVFSSQQSGHTPLHEACAQGRTSVIHFLLSIGALVDITAKVGRAYSHVLCGVWCMLCVVFYVVRGARCVVRVHTCSSTW